MVSYSRNELNRMMNSMNLPSDEFGLSKKDSIKNYHILDDIIVKSCYGPTLEKYERILFPKNMDDYTLFNDAPGSSRIDTLVDAEEKFNKLGFFVPSAPLFEEITIRLFEESLSWTGSNNLIVDDDKYNTLKQIMTGLQMVNTMIDYDEGRAVHYPKKIDLKENYPKDIPDLFNTNHHFSSIDYKKGMKSCITLDKEPCDLGELERSFFKSFYTGNAYNKIFKVIEGFGSKYLFHSKQKPEGVGLVLMGDHMQAHFSPESMYTQVYCKEIPVGDAE